jgi:type I restriction enzyme R subunit
MDDKAFEDAAFAVLSKVIYETIPAEDGVVD